MRDGENAGEEKRWTKAKVKIGMRDEVRVRGASHWLCTVTVKSQVLSLHSSDNDDGLGIPSDNKRQIYIHKST